MILETGIRITSPTIAPAQYSMRYARVIITAGRTNFIFKENFFYMVKSLGNNRMFRHNDALDVLYKCLGYYAYSYHLDGAVVEQAAPPSAIAIIIPTNERSFQPFRNWLAYIV